MREITLTNENEQINVLKVNIGKEAYSVPLSGSLSIREMKAMRDGTEDGFDFFGRYIPQDVLETLTMDQFNALNKAWKDAMKAVLPSAAKELEIFATHNSDLGANGHGYRREESVALKPVAEKFLNEYLNKGTYQVEDFLTLLDTFMLMQEAADILMTNTENPALIAEMKPWLIQHKLMGELGSAVLALTNAYQLEKQEGFLRKYKHVKALQQQMFDVDQTYNQNPYQPGVKTAGLVIKPLIDKTFAKAVELYNEKYNAQFDAKADYMPHTLTSDVNQLKNLPLRQKTNRVLVSPANEVIKWQGKGYMTIELDKIRFKGYAFQIEMKFTAYKCGFKIKEVPIIFVNRELGTSKMSGGIFSEALLGVLKLKIRSWFRKYPKA